MSKYEKEAIIMTQAIISIVSDFVLAAFPIFYFWRLQVDLKTKIGLWLLMCLGVITGLVLFALQLQPTSYLSLRGMTSRACKLIYSVS